MLLSNHYYKQYACRKNEEIGYKIAFRVHIVKFLIVLSRYIIFNTVYGAFVRC